MVLTDNEEILLKMPAETMFFSLIRRGKYTLVLTNHRLLLQNILGTKKEIDLEEITSAELYKVTFFLPFGVRFHLRNGEKLELAIIRREALANELMKVCPKAEIRRN